MAVSSLSKNKEKPVLIFLHLPKTGGSSLREFLKAKCGYKNYYEVYRNEAAGLLTKDYLNKFIALPQEERDRFDLITGHFSYGLHRFLSRPCVYVTLLRNPLERFCSNYQYLTKHSPRFRKLVARNNNIEEFLQDTEDRGRLYWGSVLHHLADMTFTPCGGGGDSALEWTGSSNMHDMDKKDLKSRLSNSFMLVGLHERLDDFALMLCRMMGWPLGVLGHENRNQSRLSVEQLLSPEQVDRANKILSTEWALYRHAEEIFQRKWEGLSTRERRYANGWRKASKIIRLFGAICHPMVQFLRDAPLPCRPLFKAGYRFVRKHMP